jgi:hypothetical protein
MQELKITKNGCCLTIKTEQGRVYPIATGRVPKSLQKSIDEIRGLTMLPEQAMNLLKHQF